MNNKINEFINFVKDQCKKYGIKPDFRKVKYLRMSDNIKCSGYFDYENQRLVVALEHKDWLETLIHEYAHFTQWLEGCPEWTENIEGIYKVDQWIGGKNIKDVQTYIGMARDLELDNEKRSVQIIKDWGLDEFIDVDEYIQKANAYVMFYNWLGKTRRWCSPKNSPYGNKNVVKMMSKKFDMEYENMDKSIERVFFEEKI